MGFQCFGNNHNLFLFTFNTASQLETGLYITIEKAFNMRTNVHWQICCNLWQYWTVNFPISNREQDRAAKNTLNSDSIHDL